MERNRLSTCRSSFPLHVRAALVAACLACVSAIVPTTTAAQSHVGGRTEIFAGSVLESYLRYLQSLGRARSEPWSIRGFSPQEVEARAPTDSAHPWARRYSLRADSARGRIGYVRPTAGFVLNTAFPFGGNDGPMWAGKGLTSFFQAGISGEWGPFSIRLAPVAYRAENASFPLYPGTENARVEFGHGQFGEILDLPQRFGDAPYSRVDPGESTLRADGFGVAAGISTASQWWGPTDMFPYVLGNNAGGFPHVFVGTSKPADLRIVGIHGRLVYGRLSQSPFSPVSGPQHYVSDSASGTRRFMAGIVAVIRIPRIPGFEAGGARFFHSPEEEDGITGDQLQLPFQNLYRRSLPTLAGRENQLGSLFVRWAPTGTGFDVYGEYGREDFSADSRDYLLKPEHAATTNIGFRKAWESGSSINALRAEVFSYESTAGSRTRDEGLVFLHGVLRQGSHSSRTASVRTRRARQRQRPGYRVRSFHAHGARDGYLLADHRTSRPERPGLQPADPPGHRRDELARRGGDKVRRAARRHGEARDHARAEPLPDRRRCDQRKLRPEGAAQLLELPAATSGQVAPCPRLDTFPNRCNFYIVEVTRSG